MYRKIIVGHDLHSGGGDALSLGQMLAGVTAAEVVVAGVFPFGALPRGFEAKWRDQEAEIAGQLQRVADDAGATAEAFPSSSPARGLHDLAEEIGADLVVVGSSRHSKLGEILAGNVGLGLLQGSPCSVAVAPRGYAERDRAPLTRIVVGFDGSDEARAALEDAAGLARASGAALELVGVIEQPAIAPPGAESQELQDALEAQMRRQLDGALSSLPDAVESEASLIPGEPATELAQAAAGASLLVLGSRGYGPVRRVLLGSVSGALARGTPCPLLVHPRPA